MKYCPNANCSHRLTSGSQAEYLDRVATCADCGAELVAAPGAMVRLPPDQPGQAESTGVVDGDEELRQRQARSDVRTGWFGIVAGLAITGMTFLIPTERGTILIAWGPILFGMYRLFRGHEQRTES